MASKPHLSSRLCPSAGLWGSAVLGGLMWLMEPPLSSGMFQKIDASMFQSQL